MDCTNKIEEKPSDVRRLLNSLSELKNRLQALNVVFKGLHENVFNEEFKAELCEASETNCSNRNTIQKLEDVVNECFEIETFLVGIYKDFDNLLRL